MALIEKFTLRYAQRFVLFTTTALAAIVFAAPVASAEVELTNEVGAAHCPSVSLSGHVLTGGCQIHLASDTPMVLELFGDEFSECNTEYDVRLDENGQGYASDQQFTGVNCGIEPCEAEASVAGKWLFEVHLKPGSNALWIEFGACWLSPLVGEIECETGAAMISSNHSTAEFDADAVQCEDLGFVHMTGHWSFESGTGVEISE